MGFEFFKRSPKQEKSPEQEHLDMQRRNAGMAAVGLAAAGVLTANEINKADDLAEPAPPTPAMAEAPADNPTLGMHSTDAPPPVVVPAAEAPATQVVDLDEKQVVIDLAEEQHVVERPEL